MFFIALLILSTVAIAGSAAYFSVYGLANTFSGVFWSVVVMGASLEAGKLIAASYLYRYWKQTNVLLKSYMMAGIAALMILTSGGIFGYLSSGYQTDVLPLKQIETQLQSLEDEKGRLVDRKKEIDKQIAQLPNNFVSARIRLMKQFQEEQKVVTTRIQAIDAEELDLKRQQIKVEAHVGPITYVARAFEVSTDNATKWLVLLIIFAFDPMAVALTLAVNNAIRRREEENAPTSAPITTQTFAPRFKEEVDVLTTALPINLGGISGTTTAAPEQEPKQVAAPEELVVTEPERFMKQKPVPVVEPDKEATFVPHTKYGENSTNEQRHPRPYFWRSPAGTLESISASDKVKELLDHYRNLKDKQAKGEPMSGDDLLDLKAIGEYVKKKGLDIYLK